MSIGIGLHCWYCEHGPCTGECERQAKLQILREKELLEEKIKKQTKVNHIIHNAMLEIQATTGMSRKEVVIAIKRFLF